MSNFDFVQDREQQQGDSLQRTEALQNARAQQEIADLRNQLAHTTQRAITAEKQLSDAVTVARNSTTSVENELNRVRTESDAFRAGELRARKALTTIGHELQRRHGDLQNEHTALYQRSLAEKQAAEQLRTQTLQMEARWHAELSKAQEENKRLQEMVRSMERRLSETALKAESASSSVPAESSPEPNLNGPSASTSPTGTGVPSGSALASGVVPTSADARGTDIAGGDSVSGSTPQVNTAKVKGHPERP